MSALIKLYKVALNLMLYKFLFEPTLEMFAKSVSTGKSKSKRTQPVRLTECLTCPKIIQSSSNKKEERFQPIKIAQLLREAENLKKKQKDSVRKKIQPERLGQLSGVKAIQKHDGAGTQVRLAYSNRCVRRNLNFNEVAVKTPKDNNENRKKSSKFVVEEPLCKDPHEPMGRKSMLLPPNTIKCRHLQNSTKEASSHSKIPQLPKQVVPTEIKNTNSYTIVRKGDKEVELNKEAPVKEKLSKSECIKISTKCKAGEVSNYTSTCVTDENRAQGSHIPCVITKSLTPSESATYQNDNCDETNSVKLKDQDRFIETLCNNMQDTRLIESESDRKVMYCPSEAICISRDQFIHLESDLKTLLAATEENVSKIKSTLRCVSALLSTNNKEFTGREEYSVLETVRHTVLDREVEVEQLAEDLKTSVSHIPQIVLTDTNYVDTSKLLPNNENNKENCKAMNIHSISEAIQESFVQLENQNNIAQMKSVQDNYIQQNTPTINKYRQKRSMKEYMALKSTMSFLETPDGKKLRSLCSTGKLDKSIVNKSYISNKVLTDLHNLYSDSPESN